MASLKLIADIKIIEANLECGEKKKKYRKKRRLNDIKYSFIYKYVQ